jgi:hypothetical protein
MRAAGGDRTTAPAEHAGRPKWLAGQANSARPQAEMSAQHCAVIFSDFRFPFNISEKYRKF